MDSRTVRLQQAVSEFSPDALSPSPTRALCCWLGAGMAMLPLRQAASAHPACPHDCLGTLSGLSHKHAFAKPAPAFCIADGLLNRRETCAGDPTANSFL